jgi:hypothetical protein
MLPVFVSSSFYIILTNTDNGTTVHYIIVVGTRVTNDLSTIPAAWGAAATASRFVAAYLSVSLRA